MAKIKLTKNELKKQKDALKMFERYLPTLILKKQQLQLVIRQVEAKVREKTAEREQLTTKMRSWIGVFGEASDMQNILTISAIHTSDGNIAGVDIPVFESMEFTVARYDLYATPLWVDRAVVNMQTLIELDVEVEILERQRDRLAEELRVTTQRVNLFEKVKIPETRENIRNIRIYLGDQQTAAVVRGKIAKKNLVTSG